MISQLFFFLLLGIALSTIVDVKTPLGHIQGIKNETSNINSFLGIPYAQPPINNLRFVEPQPILNYSKTVNATDFKSICFQFSNNQVPIGTESEDCLTLNIWTPEINTEKKLSVMLFIHGGDFKEGSGSVPFYGGQVYAEKQNVVFVTINYRLGNFGFMTKDLNGTGANQGLRDQIEAIKWVKQNIEYFGGNPESTTIFGESAGALSVCYLAVSKLTENLFKRVIMESGSCIGPWGTNSTQNYVSYQYTSNILQAYNVTKVDDLKSISAEDFRNLCVNSGWIGAVIIDQNGVVDQDPRKSYQEKNRIQPSEFIIGANSQDGLIGWSSVPPYSLPYSAGDYPYFLKMLYGSIASSIEKQYSMKRFDQNSAKAYSQVNADYTNVCPTYDLANILQGFGIPVYTYYFQHLYKCDPLLVTKAISKQIAGPQWASHASEIPFVFGTKAKFNQVTCDFDGENQLLSDKIMTLWSNFAKQGRPYTYDINWPSYNNLSLWSIALDVPFPRMIDSLKIDDCRFWDSIEENNQ